MAETELRDPLFLAAALLAPVVYLLASRLPASVTYSSLELVRGARSLRARLAWLPAALLASATALLAVALAGPRTGNAVTQVKREGIAISPRYTLDLDRPEILRLSPRLERRQAALAVAGLAALDALGQLGGAGGVALEHLYRVRSAGESLGKAKLPAFERAHLERWPGGEAHTLEALNLDRVAGRDHPSPSLRAMITFMISFVPA